MSWWTRAAVLIFALAPVMFSQEWKPLEGWKSTPFYSPGTVQITGNSIHLAQGKGTLTGANRTDPFPKSNYEIRFEAARLDGSDFFAALTFPVHNTFCTWVNGGWGGAIVGLSSLDDADASENATSRRIVFEKGRWYKFRLRVTDQIEAWIDDEQIINIPIANYEIGLRSGDIELSKPLGFAAYRSTAAIRNVEYKVLNPQ